VAQQGPPPGRPPRDYPSLDELSPEDGHGADGGPVEQGAHHRGRAERPLRVRRAERLDRPERQGWEYADPFAPDADADLPSWVPPSEFSSNRPPAVPQRPARIRPEDDEGRRDNRRDAGRSHRRLGYRRPDGDGLKDRRSDYEQAGNDQSGYDGQSGYDPPGHGQPPYDQARYDQAGHRWPGAAAGGPGRRRADAGPDFADPGYERPERAASHRRPSYEEQGQNEHGYADHGYVDQGYADQGYADQGYGERPSGGHHRPDGERPSGGHHRPDDERPSGGHHRPDGERPSGSHHRPDGERPSGSHHRPTAGALAYQQPATDWQDADPSGSDRERSRHGRPGYEAADDGYDRESANGGHYSGAHYSGARGAHYSGAHDSGAHHGDAHDSGADYSGADYSGADYAGRDPHTGPLDGDTRLADAGSTDGGAVGAAARIAGLQGRLGLPGRVRRGRAAAARLRKSRRKVYRWSGVGIAVCVVVALVVVLTHHSPKPLPYVTTLLAGEFKSVPGACNSVSAGVLNQYLPEPGRTMANQISGSTESECSFTVDRKPVFLELNVTAQAFQPFAPATAAGSKPGSATAYAADTFAEAQQSLAHPAKTAPQSPARILPLSKVGEQAFVAVASQDVTGIDSEIVTVVVRVRNVLITVAETGQESGHGFGPVSDGELEAGALAAAKNVLAKAETQPTA
jgi:hypothetical protein